jgi:hypothetical protein
MKPSRAFVWVGLELVFAAAVMLPGLSGCSAASMAGRAASTTISVAADVTAATVRGTGKVAAAAVGAGGDVADESLKVAAKLSKSGMVVFFDPKTGATWEAPWKEGLNLLAASELAKVDLALRALRVIRAGKAIGAAGEVAKLIVKSGDVIELAR